MLRTICQVSNDAFEIVQNFQWVPKQIFLVLRHALGLLMSTALEAGMEDQQRTGDHSPHCVFYHQLVVTLAIATWREPGHVDICEVYHDISSRIGGPWENSVGFFCQKKTVSCSVNQPGNLEMKCLSCDQSNMPWTVMLSQNTNLHFFVGAGTLHLHRKKTVLFKQNMLDILGLYQQNWLFKPLSFSVSTQSVCFFPFRTGELRFAWDSVGGENWSRESGVVEHPAVEIGE